MRKRIWLKLNILCFVMCLLTSQSVFGGVNVASVTNGTWNSDIWSNSIAGTMVPGLRPQPGDTPGLGSTVTLDADTPTFLQFIGVGTYTGSKGKLYTAGYDITINGEAGVGFRGSANGKYNEYYIEAGTNFTVKTGYLALAIGNSSTKCYFTQSGGVVNQLDSSSKILMSLYGSERGVYNLNDGVLNIAGSLERGPGIVNFNWNGGVLNVAESQMSLDNGGVGTLSPGGNGEIGVTEFSLDSSYTQGSTAVYQVDIANAGSYDRIIFSGANGTGTATLDGAVNISLLDGYVPQVRVTFDIIAAPNIVDNGFALTGDASNFTYSIVDAGYAKVLRLEYVPATENAVVATNGLFLEMHGSDPGNDPNNFWKPRIGDVFGAGEVISQTDSTTDAKPIYDAFGQYYNFPPAVDSGTGVPVEDAGGGQIGGFSAGPDSLPASLDPYKPSTIEAWIRPAAIRDYTFGKAIICCNRATSSSGWRLNLRTPVDSNGVDPNGKAWVEGIYFRDDAGSVETQFYAVDSGTDEMAAIPYDGSAWVHVVVTYSPEDSDYMHVYYNGVDKHAVAARGGTWPNNEPDFVLPSSRLLIGSQMLSEAETTLDYANWRRMPYQGDIACIRMYNRALSADEVVSNYRAGREAVADFGCYEDLTGDINNDCEVNLDDFAELAQQWLFCDKLPLESCN